MNYYHYTKGCHLPSIVKDGIIETSTVLLDKHVKSAVWLTKSPEWEVACNIGKVLYSEKLCSGGVYPAETINSVTVNNDYMKKEIGMCRISISETIPVVSWEKFKYVGNISETVFDVIDGYSRSIGSPVDKWICSFNPIPREYWGVIEMFVDDKWVRWEEIVPIEDFVELCLNCNGKQRSDGEKYHPSWDVLEHETNFLNKYAYQLISLWETNKHKKGYIEAYVKTDYSPYDCGFIFVEKRVKRSSFEKLRKSEINQYALVHFHWDATNTHVKIAVDYE